jgi:predicted RNase H-like HicB family nuclease
LVVRSIERASRFTPSIYSSSEAGISGEDEAFVAEVLEPAGCAADGPAPPNARRTLDKRRRLFVC